MAAIAETRHAHAVPHPVSLRGASRQRAGAPALLPAANRYTDTMVQLQAYERELVEAAVTAAKQSASRQELLITGLAGLAVLLAVLPWRWSAVVALLGLALQLSLLNQAPQSAYFAQTLQLWEQGRFVQFYGLGQWLGWLWPYALLVYVAARLTRRREPL